MAGINKIEIYKELQKELEERKKLQTNPFFSEDFIVIEYDAVNKWIYSDWRGYQTEASVMQGCEKILEALNFYQTAKVLNDNTNVVGIWTPASVWVGSNWFPRMINAGLRYFAWVYSPSVLSRVSTNETLKHTPTTQFVQTFYDMDQAKSWLHTAT